ncbi:MAG TPA: asparagine synthase (glutamine-hydrolyzing) [Burkholderiales bacterium]|nr:asparagine synthase (glutamine-hydrolyzing) [Burkholderiales bacterium]
MHRYSIPMCGIAGWIAAARNAPDDAAIAPALEAIAHRGPDGEGARAFVNRATGHRIVLGHRRLAIIDPDGARQPMCDDAAGLALTFNGEIYNFRELRGQLAARGYRFERDSDTEVLLRAYQHWGKEVVRHLRGQFAFAVWDARREELLLARDRFGEKPLYLCEKEGSLYFASEIKALLAMPGLAAQADLRAVWEYLAYRYVPGPRTLFAGIRKLPPASYALWRLGRLQEFRYWIPPDRGPRRATSQGASTEEFLAKLDEAVELQMVSDVPFGAFLSGGLDSSTVVALMSRHNAKLRTFSVGFAEDRYSELPYAGEVAKALGSAHHEIVVSHKDLIAELPRLVAFRDAPVSEPSDIPIYLLSREASRSVKMVLTGEGSDELLGGYPKHVAERLRWAWRMLPFRKSLVSPLVRALPYGFRRAKTAVANLELDDWRERYVRWFGAVDRAERDRLSVLSLNGSDIVDSMPPFDVQPGNSALRRMLYFDQTSWLPDNLLERGDRMTMAASIEARVPFLDHRLAEHISTLPDQARVRGLTGKWILREAARRLIPRRILARPKVGFRVPVNEWFRGDMRDYLLEHLRGAGSATRRYYDAAVLDRTLDEHLHGRQNHEKLLWTLLNLEIWHRTYRPG